MIGGTNMNNKTMRNFTIKRRGDHIYDIYVDKEHIASRGSIEGVIEELKIIMEDMYD